MDPANPIALSGPSCPACHAPNRDAARFCRACGKPLADRANALAVVGLVLAIVAFVGWLALGAAAAASVQRELTTASGWESWYRGWYRSDAQGAVAGVIVFGLVHLLSSVFALLGVVRLLSGARRRGAAPALVALLLAPLGLLLAALLATMAAGL